MKTTMTISNLPRDLIEEILSRVPLKSLKAVRLTCRSWNNLSKCESSKKLHIGKVTAPTREGESMMITFIPPNNLYLMSGVIDVDPSIEIKGQLSFLDSQVSISQIYHYEGLLLCISEDTTRIVVWNPYWGQTRWIEPRYSHRINGHVTVWFNYGLGYEEKGSCRNFKLLRFLDFFNNAPDNQFFWYEIYDFDSGLWTTLDVTPHWGIRCFSTSVSLKGNTYWPAEERSSNGYIDHHIICFDFTRERFGPLLPLPSSVTDQKYLSMTLSCVKEEKLAAIFQHSKTYDQDLEIWITTKIETEMVSWSKFLKMDADYKIDVSSSFFIYEEKKVFMNSYIYYDYDYDSDSDYCPATFISTIGEAGYLIQLNLGLGVTTDRNSFPRVCSYVPSLVQIKKLARDKGIEQSSLEKRRFDHNMLRLASTEKLMKKKFRRYRLEEAQKEKRR